MGGNINQGMEVMDSPYLQRHTQADNGSGREHSLRRRAGQYG